MVRSRSAVKRLVLEILGWTLVVVGIAALVLPGPGLLALAAGLALLSHQYEWAERRMRPLERRAKLAAAESVQSWAKLGSSLLLVAWLVGLGIFWIVDPDVPTWWPVDEQWWTFGGWPAGLTLIASGLIALAMIVYSIRHYRGLSHEELHAKLEGSRVP